MNKTQIKLIKQILGWLLVSQFFPLLFVIMNIADDEGSLWIPYLFGLVFTTMGLGLFGLIRLIVWLLGDV